MSFTILTETEFEQFAASKEKTSFEQSLQMAKLRKARGYQVVFLGYKDELGAIQVAALSYFQKLFGGQKLEIYYGPIYAEESFLGLFLEALKAYAKQHKVLEIVLFPSENYQTFDSEGTSTSPVNIALLDFYQTHGFKHGGFKNGYEGNQLFWHYLKDLSNLTLEDLQKSFSKKGRPLVKKAHTFGIKLQKLEREQLTIFKDITRSTSERREYSDKDLSYYQEFYDSFGDRAEFMVATLNFQDYYNHLNQDQAKLAQKLAQLNDRLEKQPESQKIQNQIREFSEQFDTFEVRKEEALAFMAKYGNDDKVLAGSLFVYMPQEAVYLFSGSYTEFNKFYAPALLQEYVMQEAIKRKIPHYNLLGITGNFDGSDGVLRFKQNFNGYIVRKMGAFTYHPRPLLYKSIQLLKKLLRR
ncbi:aminoacyltransferase [Streptococcus plurextorum]|uniref:aminoacyltransferase n=1 Tax=Streptococcus plurextorum TaxID=456876 RepID=UPI0003FDCE4B|nr:aminoacyltransferase [Streptococcus plurextorum]